MFGYALIILYTTITRKTINIPNNTQKSSIMLIDEGFSRLQLIVLLRSFIISIPEPLTELIASSSFLILFSSLSQLGFSSSEIPFKMIRSTAVSCLIPVPTPILPGTTTLLISFIEPISSDIRAST